ncbi:MAG: hypothetical protein CL927_13290 [Deltaproteobacteria bacterium]|nr:hypothetical protein [Deltaproteobacteria bacterium]
MTSPRTARRGLFAVVTTIGMFLCLEGGLRAVGVAVGWVQQRQRTAVVGGSELIVWTVGDSVTQGVPEGLPHGWPPRFAARTGATVHNLGSAGREVAWMVSDLDRRIPMMSGEVDWIIAMVGHNDCSYLEDLASIHMPDAPTPLERARRVLRQWATYRVMLQVVSRLRPVRNTEVSSMQRPRNGARESSYCRVRVASGLDALRARADRVSAQLVVSSYPIPAHKDTPGLRVNRFLDTLLEDGAQERGLPFIDTRPCFSDAPQTDWQQDGVHLTRAGYARLGDCIAQGHAWTP